MNRLAILTFLASVGIGVAGCYNAPPPPPIVIGHVMDSTRADKAGEQAELGIRLALHELDKDGALSEALGGRKVQVRHTDTRGSLDAYEAEAVRLVSINRSVALFGGLNPQQTTALEHALVPVLTYDGQKVPGSGNQVFYLGMSPSRQGDALGRTIAEDAKIERLVLLVDEQHDEAKVLAGAFTKGFDEARNKDNAKPTSFLTLRFGKDARWGDFMDRIRAHDPQGILFAGSAEDFNTCRRAYRHEAFATGATLIYGGEDGAARSFGRDERASADIVVATAFLPEGDAASAQAFLKTFQAAFHVEADVHAALAYDGLRILAEALKRAQPHLTPDHLREELQKTDKFEGLTGPLTVGADHVVQRTLFVARWRDGTMTLIKKF